MHEPPKPASPSVENALSNGMLHQVMRSLPGALAVVDADRNNNIVFVNDHFGTEFGSAFENIDSKPISILQLFSPSQHALFLSQQRKAGGVGEFKRFAIYALKNSQGQLANYYAYMSPLSSAEGNYYNVIFHPEASKWALPFTSWDSREVYLEQFNKLGFGTFEWDIREDKISWSESIFRIFELEKPIPGLNRSFVLDYTHPDDRAVVDKVLTDAVERNAPFEMEVRIITAKQNIRIVRTAGRVVPGSDDNYLKLVGSIKDITSQRKIESDLTKNLEELNRSNHELEEFAYVASHDLQEPLRKISTFCTRIVEKYADKFDAEGKMYIDRVLASADNMRMLIHNLLEFSRVARDTQPFSEVSLSFVLHQVKSDLELLIEDTGATINYGKLPSINGSLTQLKQLFHNLVANAIKFRKPGEEPVVDIQYAPLSDEEKLNLSLSISKPFARIVVSDKGIGFDNQYATRIFQIFQRLHGKSEYPGTGIGLAICKKIVDHHNGLIFAEGKQGDGARFIIILPEEQP